MRLFVWPLILSILLVMGFAEIAAPIVRRPSAHAHNLPVHKTLYLERNTFDEQMFAVLRASMEWYDATNGQVVFDIKMMPQQDIDPREAIIVLTVTPDYPEMILLDSTNNHTTLALYNERNVIPTIEFIDARISNDDYAAVALHEMGHSLGLEHPDDEEHPLNGIGSLMYSSIVLGADHITGLDLKRFCDLYHCDWRKFHGVPQVQ